MMTEEKIILASSDEAATYKTGISGWFDNAGRFWGDDEEKARWAGSTHIYCDNCQKPTPKYYTLCEACREKARVQRHINLERREWDGVTPLYSDSHDEYFFSLEDIEDYTDNYEVSVEDLQLRLCKPVQMRHLDEDELLCDLHEDAELPPEVAVALEALNKVIRNLPPQAWEPDKFAATGVSLEVSNASD